MRQFIDASLHFFLVSRLTGVNLVKHDFHLLVLIAQITVLVLELVDEHVCDGRHRRIDHRTDFLTDFRLDALQHRHQRRHDITRMVRRVDEQDNRPDIHAADAETEYHDNVERLYEHDAETDEDARQRDEHHRRRKVETAVQERQ